MISKFNIKNYKKLLQHSLKVGYKFAKFNKLSNINQNTGIILLRHDVDADLFAAANMARLESNLGITSTYFLMWRSPLYNLMGRESQKFVEEIINLGHSLGLHYDQGFDELGKKSKKFSVKCISQQSRWIEEIYNCKIQAVSFHQPSKKLIKSRLDCGQKINTYDFKKLANFKYISDSNRNFPLWNNNSFIKKVDFEAISRCFPQNLHILFHPMWWIYDEKKIEDVWDKVLINKFNITQKQLVSTERTFGKKRILKLK